MLLVSDHTPSIRMNYTAVPCHCCWHAAFHLFQPFTLWENECVIQSCVSECSPSYQNFYIPEIQVDVVSGYITFIFITMVHNSWLQ